jgi:hypothetical protein
MVPATKSVHQKHKGAVLILSMIFLVIFSALAVSMATMSGTNAQLASNQHKINSALMAAQSGLECGKYVVASTTPYLPSTGKNYVTSSEADQVWNILCQRLQLTAFDGQSVQAPGRFSDAHGSGDEIVTVPLNFGSVNTDFTLRFYRYDSEPQIIKLQSKGTTGEAVRLMNIDMHVTKDSEVLNYAVASRGRMWLTGESTIHGDIFSAWDREEISPYNMTSDSSVYGTINTVLTLDQIKNQYYQLETLDENDNPIDVNGAPLGGDYENRYYGPYDEIQAYHEGINYEQPYNNMPGMDISDYDTDLYNSDLVEIPTCPYGSREVEYFPHAAGNYNYPRDGTPSYTPNRKLTRHVYENETFTNAKIPNDRNALFRNCTFEEVLYVDCSKTGYTNYNNVRFENCNFNGVIVTDVPQTFKWQHNCLYFTGEAAFENTSSVQEATILAPHFNVNLGNTNPVQTENNVLTGAIIGGIVDVRGNAQIYGTIISMCDTTQWPSGYVTNIGATLDDGGSETTELGDIGVISITPDQDQMLPSGITTPIIIRPLQGTYSEG